MKPLAVVIPSKSISNLLPCVEAVRKHEPDAQIIIIDDGLESYPLRAFGGTVRGISGNVVIISGRKPFVFARNINLGIRAAVEADIVACNDDAILETPGGFSLLQREAEAHPDFGIIAATTNQTGQPLQRRLPDYHPQYGLRDVTHVAFVAVLIPWRTRRILEGEEARCANAMSVLDSFAESPEWARNPAFTGGFLDERFVSYGCDDADYCMQVNKAGLKVGVHDRCFVDHESLSSSYRGGAKNAGDFSHNYKLLIDKWGKLLW